MSCIYTIKGIVQVHISASFWCPDALEDGQKKIIADRYGKGATMAELAEEYGVGPVYQIRAASGRTAA